MSFRIRRSTLFCGWSLLAAATVIVSEALNNDAPPPRRIRIGNKSRSLRKEEMVPISAQLPVVTSTANDDSVFVATTSDNGLASNDEDAFDWVADALMTSTPTPPPPSSSLPDTTALVADAVDSKTDNFEWAEMSMMSMIESLQLNEFLSLPSVEEEVNDMPSVSISEMSISLVKMNELSMSIGNTIIDDETEKHLDEFAIMMEVDEMSMKQSYLEVFEFKDDNSMSMSTDDNTMPTDGPTAGPKLIQNEVSIFSTSPTSKAAKTPAKPPKDSTTTPSLSPNVPSTTESPVVAIVTPYPSYFPTTAWPSYSPSSSYPTNSPSSSPTKPPSSSPSLSPTTSSPTTSPTTSSPTTSPTTSSPTLTPTKEVIGLETDIQLQLVGMTSEMNDEATNVFEESCAEFLNKFLGEAQPPIFDVECKVTNQQFLSAGRLRRQLESTSSSSVRGKLQHRILQEEEGEQESSLITNVYVNGSAYPTDSVSQASDIPFYDLVYGTFTVQSAQFVDTLKESGSDANIDDFESLSNVYTIRNINDGNSIESPADGSNGNSDSEANSNNKGKAGAIASMVISGVVILGLFGAYFYHVGQRSQESVADEDSEIVDVYNDSLLYGGLEPRQSLTVQPTETSPYSQSNQQSLQSNLTEDTSSHYIVSPRLGVAQSGESKNDQLTYMYSLDDGLASPSSLLSQAAGSPLTMNSNMKQQMSWIDGAGPVPPNRIRVDVNCPPGKLGIIIDTCSEGPIVHSVKQMSPLDGLIFKGDLVVAVDDEDTREWSAHFLTKLVAKKSMHERKISVMRNAESKSDDNDVTDNNPADTISDDKPAS